ncbi:MAG: hypothetical protein AB1668_06180 [Nanoarchaeota archaeon]
MKTLEKILSVVGLAGALAACGADNGKESCTKDSDCKGDRVCDSELGYCVDADGSSGSSGGSSSGNPQGYCGNSPLYGKYLWGIDGCKWGLEMRNDCSVINDSSENFGTYSGLRINNPPGGYSMSFYPYPDFHFDTTDYKGDYSVYNQAVNDTLNKYGGYVLIADTCIENGFQDVKDNNGNVILDCNCHPSHPDDCSFIPLDSPYPGPTGCKDSEYYAGIKAAKGSYQKN